MGEKDSLGDKLRDRQKAQEDQWARERDQELLQKMREKKAVALACPRCKKKLEARIEGGIAILCCPDGEGAWLDAAALREVLTHK